MTKRFRLLIGLAGFAALLVVLGLVYGGLSAEPASSKSPALPLAIVGSDEGDLAQDLALADSRVQALILDQRSEVFQVRRLGRDVPTGRTECTWGRCLQVEIYNYDKHTTVIAVIAIEEHLVLDVFELPNSYPVIQDRHAEQAVDIIINARAVREALGYRPEPEDVILMMGGLQGTDCDGRHLCAAATFLHGDQLLWAHADLTTGELAGIAWVDAGRPDGQSVLFEGAGCPSPGSINRGGWQMNFETSGTDGLHITEVFYYGTEVAHSMKRAEWHVDYGLTGFQDQTGCGGAVFVIAPYGETQIVDILDGSTVIGFEVIQDFRMAEWGAVCNYRYEDRFQFFNDGSFRVYGSAFGKGCGTPSTYRPIFRLDISIDDGFGDSFAFWDGSGWDTLDEEDYRVPDNSDPSQGPHQTDGNGFAWRVLDDSGLGYHIELDSGQFAAEELGSEPYIYVTRYHGGEGSTDIPPFGNCCNDTYVQGPEQYIDGEDISGQNIVIWHVAQSFSEDDVGSENCWTISGEPPLETYPCFAGPMFYPVSGSGPTLFGSVDIDGRSDESGAVASLWQGATQVISFTSLSDGTFGLLAPDGSYDLRIEVPGFISYEQNGVVISGGGPVNIGAIVLLAGDANDDGTINILDISAIGAAYGKTCSDDGYEARFDLNADCTIDLADLNLASTNFGAEG